MTEANTTSKRKFMEWKLKWFITLLHVSKNHRHSEFLLFKYRWMMCCYLFGQECNCIRMYLFFSDANYGVQFLFGEDNKFFCWSIKQILRLRKYTATAKWQNIIVNFDAGYAYLAVKCVIILRRNKVWKYDMFCWSSAFLLRGISLLSFPM